jgi:hypothetical protein
MRSPGAISGGSGFSFRVSSEALRRNITKLGDQDLDNLAMSNEAFKWRIRNSRNFTRQSVKSDYFGCGGARTVHLSTSVVDHTTSARVVAGSNPSMPIDFVRSRRPKYKSLKGRAGSRTWDRSNDNRTSCH